MIPDLVNTIGLPPNMVELIMRMSLIAIFTVVDYLHEKNIAKANA
eukprot:CAMPEP_0176379436 /NCGR_PEP_ID=MMETSP0126-20121128/30356_1 /TAXON_ID=141414 ORGANISM="Strombidinopsis acuminatum, Strain SPMC142" /NCGR_SAMPLE_ID=MMETSP0126 /ASSEMBLY_ACC=CAM_ASM_000229 /LENGTH=44 /DNA_ID= /DNA_START= /DNA_END= /DNA_ORIENTATION=